MKYQSCVSLVAVFCIAPALGGFLQQHKIQFDFHDSVYSDLPRNHIFDPEDASTKIFGGQEAAPNQFPYQALLIMKNLDLGRTACGGSLIAPKYVLTAAHCVFQAFSVDVTLGAYNRSMADEPDRQTYTDLFALFSVRKHLGYNPITLENDIAVVRLPYATPLTAAIQPIALPNAIENFIGTNATASGWGMFAPNSSLADILRFAQAPIAPDQTCKDIFGNSYTTKSLCWGGSQGQAAGAGDSGGPLAVQQNNTPVLVGITSYGRIPFQDYPSVFVKVTEYLPWIEARTGVTPPN